MAVNMKIRDSHGSDCEDRDSHGSDYEDWRVLWR
jgi:hypothetical protein